MKLYLIILLIFIIILLYLIWIYYTNLIENKITICVKTIYRSKAIGKFVKDTRKLLPYVTIIISDDSDDSYKLKNKESIEEASPNDKNIIYIDLPYDSGVSKGRNACIERVKTPYTIITDDTRVITDYDHIYKLIKYLDNNPEYDMITGHIPQRHGIHIKYIYNFDKISVNNNFNLSKKNIIKHLDNLSEMDVYVTKDITKNKDGFDIVNLGHQHAIARTEIFKENKWNDKLKTGDHHNFFIKLWANDINILYDNNFIFNQFDEIYRKYDENGEDLRNRDYTEYDKIINMIGL